MSADRNLLLGVLALQMDFITRDELVAAMNTWVLTKEKPLGEILRAQGTLAAEELDLLTSALEKRLTRRVDDPENNVAVCTTIDTLREAIANAADANVLASLIGLPTIDHRRQSSTPTNVGVADGHHSVGQRFRVLREHAKGGLGEVFVALDEELHREVALKQILEQHADNAESRARFVQEAEITGSLEHPGIVPVYGLGTDADGRPFYAMRFIRGDSLQDAIRRFHQTAAADGDPGGRILELRRLLGHLIAVCNAIEYAHNRGVLHRDIKPSNVMLGKFGETLVVDWGLAKTLGHSIPCAETTEPTIRPSGSSVSEPTQMGTAVGTPAYMSPEQAAGRLDELGPPSDVYGLGATLYSVLSGKRPFDGGNVPELLDKVKKGAFPHPREVSRAIPPALEAVCLKAMALEPADRYPSARALADDLEHWLGDEPVTALLESSLQRVARWSRRHAGLVWSAAISSFVITIAAALIGRYYWLAKANAAETETARVTAAADRKLAESDRFSALLNRTRQRNVIRAPGWVKQSLEDLSAAAQLAPAANQRPQLRSEAAKCLASMDFEEQTPVGTTANYSCLSFTPDSSTLAVAQRNVQVQLVCSVLLVDPKTGEAKQRLPMVFGWSRVGDIIGKASKAQKVAPDGARCLAFSPPGKGRWLVVGTRNGELFRWDLDDPRWRSVRWDAHGQNGVSHVVFSADASSLYSVGMDRTVRRWDIPGGWTQAAVYESPDEIRDCAIDAVSGDFVCVTTRDTLTLSPQKLEAEDSRLGPAQRVAVSLDGHTIARSVDNHIFVHNGSNRRLLHELYDDSANKVFDGGADQLAFSRDGLLIVAASDGDRRMRLWFADNGRLAASVMHPGLGNNRFAFAPDGRKLAVANDQRTTVYALHPSDIESVVAHSSMPIEHLATSADLGRIACRGRSGEINLWDRSGEQFVRHGEAAIARARLHKLVMSADGSRLVAEFADKSVGSCKISDDGSREFEGTSEPELDNLALAPDGQLIWGSKSIAADRLLEGEAVQSFDFEHRKPISEPCVVTRDLLTSLGNVECIAAGKSWVLAGCHDGTVAVVNAPEAQMTDRLFVGQSDCVTVIAQSGNESLAVVGTEAGRVCVFSVPAGKAVGKADAHSESVTSLAISRNGELIATASPDRTIRLWKLHSIGLQELLTLQFHAPVVSVHLSSDGSRLAALVAGETAVRIWNIARLRSRLNEMSLDW